MFNGSLKLLPGSSIPTTQRGALCRVCDLIEFFFVAHPDSGRKEGEEHKRVMYFHSEGSLHALDKQTEITGFAEAVVNFTEDFTRADEIDLTEYPFRFVTTQNTVHVYVLVENAEYLLGIALNKKSCKDMEYTIFMPTLRTVLIDAYKMFKLFFGTFRQLQSLNDVRFRERLEYFFSRYLSQLRLYHMPLLNHFSGVDFQQLKGTVYLNVETLIAETREEFPSIQKVLFLYQDKLLYYSVNPKDMASLYRYLTENLLPMSLRAELEPHTSQRGSSSIGRFLTGPADLNSDTPLGKDDALPTVHLTSDNGETLIEYQLIVYRCLNATVCLFSNEDVSRLLMRNIDGFLGAELGRLASEIGDAVSTQVGELRVSDFHYVYFNPASLSLRTSFHQPTIVGGGPRDNLTPPPVPQKVHKLACDSFDKLMLSNEEFGECFVKDSSEWWIVLKKVNQRVLLLLLPPSSSCSTLPEAQIRAHEIIKSRFQSIFLL